MRVPLVLWLFCVLSLPAAAAESKRAPQMLHQLGQEYQDVQSWAEANRFQLVWTKKDDEFQLTNRWAKLELKVKSLRAEVNGISLFLSFPILLHDGMAFIAQRDLDRTIKPILFPPKNKAGEKLKVVAISAGHGGKDCGYQVGTQQEKKYTLLLAKQLQELVARAGLKPMLIRTSDKLVDREERPKMAKRAKADLYVELHYNSAGVGNNESRGVEVYCLTPVGANSTNGGPTDQFPGTLNGNRHDERNILLAYQLQKALVNNAGLVDRGVRRARFVVLREADIPAVLIEAGFMSQPDEMAKIQDESARRQTAEAILDGILAYKRLVER
jgi:N-acetylmuramoyl-L-alanine amidase